MNDLDALAFAALFKEAYQKCFGHDLNGSLSETESKLFSSKIFDQTGLVIGPKSIKNYSLYVLNPGGKEENPSIATMDTLARYVSGAPYTDEVQRKSKESHYPYWFKYKNEFHQSHKKVAKRKFLYAVPVLAVVIVLVIVAILFFSNNQRQKTFIDKFLSVNEDSLNSLGWMVQSKDEDSWNKRNQHPGSLSLFTLKGDNWPDSADKPAIKNLLIRKISSDCFTTEVHLAGFVPRQNWQQAGILLMEDTNFTGKSLRLSILYNDFSGGFPKSRDIIVQVIASQGKDFYKPEELAHQLIFKLDATNENVVKENLEHSALRIEKNGTKFRLLYANGSMANSAFKEVISKDIDMKPKYIGLFALRGFVDSSSAIPARFDYFSYSPQKCER
jgi:Beta xylosidase C-terminal Concanavalin A-like domain